MPSKIPDDELKQDVEQVADKLGHPPTRAEYDESGEYSAWTVSERFGDGSWPAALEELGYVIEDKSRRSTTISDEDLKQDVERVANELGHPPTYDEYNDLGDYSTHTVAKKFGDGSWPAALEELGYEVDGNQVRSQSIPDERLKQDVERVAEEVNSRLTMPQYNALGRYSAVTIAKRFGDGSWLAALDELGYED